MGRSPGDSVGKLASAGLAKPVAIVAVGDPDRGDETFAREAARALREKPLPESVEIYTGGDNPERVLGPVEKLEPGTVLFLKAVDFGGAPGELAVVAPDDVVWGTAVSQHPSLEKTAKALQRRQGARILLLAAQPASTSPGSPVSPEIEKAARRAADLLREALGRASRP